MNIVDCTAANPPELTERAQAGGKEYCLAVEHTLQVFVNEQLAMRIVCSPGHLDELVAGRLLSEGLIRRAEEIRKLYLCAQGLICRVWLEDTNAPVPSPARAADVGTCCTDSRILTESKYGDLGQVIPAAWEPRWLLACTARLREGEALYGSTRAAHACYLGRGEDILCAREDIGRHNALDKAVGYGLISGAGLGACWLFTTGRMPADMVAKAIRAGVPLLASKTFPTAQGLAMAKRAGLTLVTVRDGETVLVWNDGY